MSRDDVSYPLEAPASVALPRKRTFSERAVLHAAGKINRGELTLHHSGRSDRFGVRSEGEISAEIEVRDRGFFPLVATRGVIGVAESYRDGKWDTPDLVAVVRLLVRNRRALESVDGRLAFLARPLRWFLHRRNRNTVVGSQRNIAAHYDLSNDFFRLLLDESMTYSAGIFEETETETDADARQQLAAAQFAKLDRLCKKLDLGSDDRVLEIGTGWGSFALHAAEHYGCRVTTTTISKEQHAVAKERIEAAGLGDRIDIRLSDYRQLEGTFNKVVSIEMIEAVGHEYYEEFFTQCARLTTPDATFAMQAITIADASYDRARRTVDFIKHSVFPGSNIPSVTALLDAATAASDWRLCHLEDITEHYCQTLAAWRDNLHRHADEIETLGLDERFRRWWDFYLSYCEGGFAERHIGTVHLLFSRSEWRGEAPLPPLR